VAVVTVSPVSQGVSVGRSTQFTAILTDSIGNVLSGRVVSWTTSNSAVATVTATGLATGRGAGVVTVSASSEGKTGTAALTVTLPVPPPQGQPGNWPHEPTGLAVLTDYGFGDPFVTIDNDQPLGTSGWTAIFIGTTRLAIDPTAPLSPPTVAEFKYPVGFEAGSAPGTFYFLMPNQRRLFVGFWWKVSDPWQGQNSGVNKIAFIWSGNTSNAYFTMFGSPGGPYELRFCNDYALTTDCWVKPTVSRPVTLGVWHKVELLLDVNAQMYSWWLDGVQLGAVPGYIPAFGLTLFSFSPTWGGVGDSKTQNDYFWIDHVHISGAP
jgi:hypothetical protein